MFAGGVSLYEGQIDQAVAASTISPKKQLVGLDGEIQLKDGTFLTGEFTTGTYEKRSYFDEALAGSKAFAQVTDAYVNGNQVETYYIWLGHTFHMTSDHPLSLLVDYDVFQRSTSANNVTQNILGAQESTFYSSGSSFTDVNVGGGVLYNTSKNGRLRLWYDAPLQVAHAPGTPTPPNIGLWTFEYLMRF
jgi:hypothetical protein